ncbi:MAG: hypothetical protein JXD22_11660 [Sedimentisphaerales bacterium]|nr:hypothetical protein [Sedimentisphaerales bacterium]
MPQSDVETALETNAQGPARVSGDQGSVSQHSLSEQIAADKHLASKAAARAGRIGLRLHRMKPPGTV